MTGLNAEQDSKFEKVCISPYAEQGRFFLNAFWDELAGSKAMDVYNACKVFTKIDVNGAGGCDLEAPAAHTALERLGHPMSAVELRALLEEIDITVDNKLCLIEYLLFKYNDISSVTLRNLMTRPQGSNQALYDAEDELKRILAKQAARSDAINDLRQQSQSGSLSIVKRNQIKHALDMELQKDDIEIPMSVQRCKTKIEKASKNGDGKMVSTGFWIQADIDAAAKYEKTYINTRA